MDFREFVQNSLNPPLHVAFLEMSGTGLLDMARGTDATSTDCTVTAQTIALCNSTTVLSF